MKPKINWDKLTYQEIAELLDSIPDFARNIVHKWSGRMPYFDKKYQEELPAYIWTRTLVFRKDHVARIIKYNYKLYYDVTVYFPGPRDCYNTYQAKSFKEAKEFCDSALKNWGAILL